jgi:hypothetical protein
MSPEMLLSPFSPEIDFGPEIDFDFNFPTSLESLTPPQFSFSPLTLSLARLSITLILFSLASALCPVTSTFLTPLSTSHLSADALPLSPPPLLAHFPLLMSLMETVVLLLLSLTTVFLEEEDPLTTSTRLTKVPGGAESLLVELPPPTVSVLTVSGLTMSFLAPRAPLLTILSLMLATLSTIFTLAPAVLTAGTAFDFVVVAALTTLDPVHSLPPPTTTLSLTFASEPLDTAAAKYLALASAALVNVRTSCPATGFVVPPVVVDAVVVVVAVSSTECAFLSGVVGALPGFPRFLRLLMVSLVTQARSNGFFLIYFFFLHTVH